MLANDGDINILSVNSSDQIVLGSSSANISIPSILQGQNALIFDGATVDGVNRTTLAITDPTEARTITFQDNTGVVPLSTAGNTIFFTTSGATALTLPLSGTVIVDTDTTNWDKDASDDLTTSTVLFTIVGDSTHGNNLDRTIIAGNSLNILGGTGITTIAGEIIDTLSLSFTSTELDDLTWGDGSKASFTWNFDVTGTDTSLTFGSASLASSATTLTLGGSSTIHGGADESGTLTLSSTSHETKGNIQFFDTNTFITSSGNMQLAGNITTDGTLSVRETGSSPEYYTTFQGGDQLGNITYTLPTSSADGLLKNTGGVLSWDSTSYLTSEADTLASVTGRGNTTSTGIILTQNGNLVSSYGLQIKRSTDTTPLGNLLQFQSADGLTDLFSIDTDGSLLFGVQASSPSPTTSKLYVYDKDGTPTIAFSGSDICFKRWSMCISRYGNIFRCPVCRTDSLLYRR
jgi:hypothetical protein